MSVYDNQVHKCERCGELYTWKTVADSKEFKYRIVDANYVPSGITVSTNNPGEFGLCPKCLKQLTEWMEGPSIPPEDLRETPLAKALREFAETVKGIKTGL